MNQSDEDPQGMDGTMELVGSSKSGRVRKKSAKLLEMEEVEELEKKIFSRGSSKPQDKSSTKSLAQPPLAKKPKMISSKMADPLASGLGSLSPHVADIPQEDTTLSSPVKEETATKIDIASPASKPGQLKMKLQLSPGKGTVVQPVSTPPQSHKPAKDNPKEKKTKTKKDKHSSSSSSARVFQTSPSAVAVADTAGKLKIKVSVHAEKPPSDDPFAFVDKSEHSLLPLPEPLSSLKKKKAKKKAKEEIAEESVMNEEEPEEAMDEDEELDEFSGDDEEDMDEDEDDELTDDEDEGMKAEDDTEDTDAGESQEDGPVFSNTEAMALKLKTSAERASMKKKRKDKEGRKQKKRHRRKGPTAYTMFCNQYRGRLLEQNPSLATDFASISKRLGEIWQSLPRKDKTQYRAKAKRRLTLMNRSKELTAVSGARKVPSRSKTSTHLKVGDFYRAPGPPMIQTRTVVNESSPQSCGPVDVAAHLKLLGDSLFNIGARLMEHQGQIAVQGGLSVLLDSMVCALGPLMCLTNQVPQLHGCPNNIHRQTLDNIAYIMPGIG